MNKRMKNFIVPILALTLTATSYGPVFAATEDDSRVYLKEEAEAATLSGEAKVEQDTTYSGGEYVNGLANGTITFNEDIAKAGEYDLAFYYGECSTEKTLSVSINGTSQSLNFAGNILEDAKGVVTCHTYLQAGENEIALSGLTDGAPSLDKLVISKNIASEGKFNNGTGTYPESWHALWGNTSWTDDGIDDSRCIHLENVEGGQQSAVWCDMIELEPYQYYVAEVRVKANIAKTLEVNENEPEKEGAVLWMLMPSYPGSDDSYIMFPSEKSNFINNTDGEWQTLRFNFQASYAGEVRFMFYACGGAGTADFDNFTIYPDDDMVKLESDRLMLGTRRSSMTTCGKAGQGISKERLATYLPRLETYIDHLEDLAGVSWEVLNGEEKMKLVAVDNLQWAGEAATPTYIWYGTNWFKNTELGGLEDYNTIDFSMYHELGHKLTTPIANFMNEPQASLNAFLTLTELDTELVYQSRRANTLGGSYLSNIGIQKYYKEYPFIQLYQKAGLVPFKNTYKYFNDAANKEIIPTRCYPKLVTFVNKLKEEAIAQGCSESDVDEIFTKEIMEGFEAPDEKTSSLTVFPVNGKVYEAETDGDRDGKYQLWVASNGSMQYVGGVENQALDFQIDRFTEKAEDNAYHALKINYIAYQDTTMTISVNGQTITANCPALKSGATYNAIYVVVPLANTTNTVSFKGESGKSLCIDNVKVLY